MSNNLRNFVKAIYAFDAVVQRTGADQWGNDTPCEGWNATDLVQHQCAVVNGVEQVAATGQMAKPTPPSADEMADPAAAWAASRDRILETLDQHQVLAQQGPFWFEAPTVDDLIGIVLWDLTAHAWDLAQATGQPHGLDPALAQVALDVVEPMSEMLVSSSRTASPVEIAADAPVVDRYLAAIGRTPNAAG